MIHLREQYWAVEVPEDFTMANIWNNQVCSGELVLFPLPAGNWQIVCTSKEVTEAAALAIVQVISNGRISGQPQYRRYDRDPVKDTPARSWTRDPRHGFETLLTSKGGDLKLNWLILKKQDAHT